MKLAFAKSTSQVVVEQIAELVQLHYRMRCDVCRACVARRLTCMIPAQRRGTVSIARTLSQVGNVQLPTN